MTTSVVFRRTAQLVILACMIAFLQAGCGGSSASDEATDNPRYYFGSMTRLALDVAYEPNWAPLAVQQWSLVNNSLAALFSGRSLVPEILIPVETQDLQVLPEQGRTAWRLQDLLLLERAHRKRRSSGTTGRFWIVFLGGYYSPGGQGDRANEAVLGVNVVGTSVIALFAPALRAAANGATASLLARFIEQTTIVHELGHALGLVNNGLPLRSEHHDRVNGAHCTNTECVMFWKNEGRESLLNFVENYRKNGNTVLFGSECLQDTQGFRP